MSGVMSDFRQDLVDLLNADSYFDDVTVLKEDDGNIVAEINKGLGLVTEKDGKVGVFCLVLTAMARCTRPNLPGPYLGPITVVVHVEEDVTINTGATGTGKAASDVAERVATLHRQSPNDGRNRAIVIDAPAITKSEPFFGSIAYDVRFTYDAGIAEVRSQVATPTADPDEGAAPQTVTLTCATSEAAIYYTVDGTRPASTNGTLYTAPVAIAAACTLKAQAVRPGYINSEVLSAVFT